MSDRREQKINDVQNIKMHEGWKKQLTSKLPMSQSNQASAGSQEQGHRGSRCQTPRNITRDRVSIS